MVEEIYRKIDSKRTDTGINSTELYHSITAEIVHEFFTEEDQDFIVPQIKQAKRGQWDTSNYNPEFFNTASAIKISEPYFSKDKTKAIVFVITPSLERAEFYRKIEGNWEYYFGSLFWIE